MKDVSIKIPIETIEKFEVLYNSLEKYPSIVKTSLIKRGVLLEGVFSVKDSKIDSKIFHSWKLDGLLPNVPKGQWAKLSFVDLLWLYILETMRNFGCNRNLMKVVSKMLNSEINSVNYLYHIVTNYLRENNEMALIIYLDGSFSTYEENENIELSTPHIVIPISSFIKKSMSDSKITRKILSAYDFIN